MNDDPVNPTSTPAKAKDEHALATEALKQKYGLYKVMVGTFGVAVISSTLPFIIETSRIQLDTETTRRDFVTEYTQVLEREPDAQLALVDYFSHVLPDSEQRSLWAAYGEHLRALEDQRAEAQAELTTLEAEDVESNTERIRALQEQLDRLDRQLQPPPPVDAESSRQTSLGFGATVPYDPAFLGAHVVEMPQVVTSSSSGADGSNLRRLDYVHWSGIYDLERAHMRVVAYNVDQRRLINTRRTGWKHDPRLPISSVMGNEYYVNNRWDRGNLVRRSSIAWGDNLTQANLASASAMTYPNATLQYDAFNQDEWLFVEDCVASWQFAPSGKLSAFAGPLYSDSPRVLAPDGVPPRPIPDAFWKVLTYIDDTGALRHHAWIVPQDETTTTNRGGRRNTGGCVSNAWSVSIQEVEQRAELQFASIPRN